MAWVKLRWLEPIRHKTGLLVGEMLTPAVKPQWVCNKLDETLEQSYSDVLHRPWKCVRVIVDTTSIRLSEDNHDSWVTCITSTECKTVITAVLTVMSGMDPHMIRWNLRWVWFGLVWLVGLSKWISLGCGSVMV
jgi:hypothetical protein